MIFTHIYPSLTKTILKKVVSERPFDHSARGDHFADDPPHQSRSNMDGFFFYSSTKLFIERHAFSTSDFEFI